MRYQTFEGWMTVDRTEIVGRNKKRRPKQEQLITRLGHIKTYVPFHHFADAHGYVREHRLIWEHHYRAILLPWAMVYHINGNRHDNRIENFEIKIRFSNSKSGRKKFAESFPLLLKKMGLD